MRVWRPVDRLGGYTRAFVAVALAFGLSACGLDKQDDPAPIGPSETGISVQLQALPDTVNADGVSQAVVELVLRDQNGQPAAGRAVLFEQTAGDGKMYPSADSTYVGPVQENFALVMATSDTGTAVVVYVAGRRRMTASIRVRPYSFDAVRPWYSSVEIIQR